MVDHVSNATYFYNALNNTLTDGPPLAVPRVAMQCSRMVVSATLVYVVVAGGYIDTAPPRYKKYILAETEHPDK